MRIVVLSLVLFTSVVGRADEPVELRWRVPAEGEIVAFSVWQNETSEAPGFDVDPLAAGAPAPRALLEMPATLPPPKVALALTRRTPTTLLAEIVALASLLPDGVKADPMFGPGSVQEWCELGQDGSVLSFWKPARTKNVFVMLAGLPKAKVRVGDTWPIDANLLEIAGYRPTRAARVAVAKLVALRPEGGELVAVVEYTLAESFSGPSLAKEIPATRMAMGYVGRGEFLVHAGRWQSLLGRTRMESDSVKPTTSLFGMRWLPKVPALVRAAVERTR